jgi:hypothetical protein
MSGMSSFRTMFRQKSNILSVNSSSDTAPLSLMKKKIRSVKFTLRIWLSEYFIYLLSARVPFHLLPITLHEQLVP